MNKANLITCARLIAILAAVIITGIIPVAFADPSLNTDNGHYYEYIYFVSSWIDAKNKAESLNYNNINGHLVTITSQSENDFVANLIPDGRYAWIGLTDEVTEGQYEWVQTGESYDYTNWEQAQPNNRYGEEHYVEISEDTGKWNDTDYIQNTVRGFVVEYTLPITAQNPDNNHYYQYIQNSNISWTEAKLLAETSEYNGTSGHLVTITSESENDFVTDLITDDSYAWIGLTDEDTEGTYTWVNDELYDYTNWDSSQPNNRYNGEHYAEIAKDTGKWNDSRDIHNLITGYVIEYSD